MKLKNWIRKWGIGFRGKIWKMMKCIRSREQLKFEDVVDSSESLATRDYSASGFSSRAGEIDPKLDNSNIEEAESSLRESGFLNYEEARALLGRLEYQKGNTEAALHVYEGIDIATVTARIRASLPKRCEQNRRHSQSDAVPPMSMHSISLLLEAIFLKSKSLQALRRFGDAAASCKMILDTVESALPDGVPQNILADCKLQEILNKAVELLPELWKLAVAPEEAMLSYRRALLYNWNMDIQTKARIEKEYAIFLLYSGTDTSPPNLRSQKEGSFIPRNNIEEAVLLLLILLRKFSQGRIPWDPTIMDHLSFALSISGGLLALAHQVEKLLPGIFERRERYLTLALCYSYEGKDVGSLNLLRNLLNNREKTDCFQELLLASKICAEKRIYTEEGITYCRKAIEQLNGRCSRMTSTANCLLGILLSNQSRLAASDSEMVSLQSDAINALETARRMTREPDPRIIFHLSLENAEQRKLDIALYYAKQLLKLEAGCRMRSYLLLARILSAQKCFVDANSVITSALEQTGKWEQGELLRTKARLQVAEGNLTTAVETYTHLLAVLQVQAKSFGAMKKLLKHSRIHDRSLEVETWHDLANLYTSLSQWRDAEVCLSKSEAISKYSASRWHSRGLLYEAKGELQESLKAFNVALDINSNHVPTLISTASVLMKLGSQYFPIIRSFLTDALRLDKINHSAWYNLGLLYKADTSATVLEAAECFEAAALLEETAPIEPFR